MSAASGARLAFAIFVSVAFFSGSVCAAPNFARGVILANLDTGRILYGQNMNAQIPPASLTKIMTMFLTFDAIKNKKLSLNSKLAVSREAAKIGGSAMRLAQGEKVPATRLLAGAAVASGNDAAMTLAQGVGGSVANFVRQMNLKARRLGMTRTVFKNPTGLPVAGQKTSAYDLYLLVRAYLKAYPQAERFHSMTYFMHKGSVNRNTNSLLGRDPRVTGLKTGWTVASGYNLAATAKKGEIRLLAIALGCPTKKARDRVILALLDAGFRYPNNSQKAGALLRKSPIF